MAYIIVIRDTRTNRSTELDFLTFEKEEAARKLCDKRNAVNELMHYEYKWIEPADG